MGSPLCDEQLGYADSVKDAWMRETVDRIPNT